MQRLYEILIRLRHFCNKKIYIFAAIQNMSKQPSLCLRLIFFRGLRGINLPKHENKAKKISINKNFNYE